MKSSLNPTLRSVPDMTVWEDPYVKFVIDRRHHEDIFYTRPGEPVYDCSFSHNETETVTKFDKKFIGIASSSNHTSLEISVDLEVPETRLYRVEVLLLRGPDYTGAVQTLEGSTRIGNVIPTSLYWVSENWFKTPVKLLRSGSHTITISLTKLAYIARIKIVPVTREEGDSDGSYYGDNEIEVNNATWSRNSISEMNSAEINMAFTNRFYQNLHKYSPYIFSLMDSLTILVGRNRHETIPLFGGYMVGFKRTGKELSLIWNDSLLNMQKDIMYENYAIGTPPDEGKSYVQFSNLAETIKYIVETTLHQGAGYNTPHQNGFKIDFSVPESYSQITCSGFEKDRTLQGTPGYCLKLYRNATGAASAVLYQNQTNPYNAITYPILNIDYKAADSANAMACDIFITMHKEGEDISKAIVYAVNFSGAGGHDNTIATITPVWNGVWNYVSLNLPALFTAAGIYGTGYYISKIELKGTISSTSPPGAMYLNNIFSYQELSNTTRHSNEEVKSIFEILQDIGESTKYSIYSKPGLERCDDVIVAQPYENTTLPVRISDDSDLITCDEYGSMPLENGFLNQAHTSFDIDDNNVGSSFKEKLDSVIHFEEYQRHEFSNDLKSQVDVDNFTQKKVDTLSSPMEYLTCTIIGNPYCEPNQNVNYSIDEYRCSGFGMLKTIQYNYVNDASPKLTAEVGINRAGTLYDKVLFKIYRDLYNINLTNRSGSDIYRSRIS